MKFNELSERGKERARTKQVQYIAYGWWEGVYEDFMRIACCLGYTVEEGAQGFAIEFTGFGSQSDGAAFNAIFRVQDAMDAVEHLTDYCKDETLHRLAVRVVEACTAVYGISQLLCFSKRLCTHLGYARSSLRMRIDSPSSEYLEVVEDSAEFETLSATLDAFDAEILDVADDLARWLYKALETEYEYLTSDAAIIEQDLNYTEDGFIDV